MAAWVLRDTTNTKAQGSVDRPLIVSLAIIPIFVLSVIVAWFLAHHYSLSDDNAIALGLLGTVFVVLFDLFLLVFLVGGKLREGQIAAAVKDGLLLVGLGLLIVPVVGALPWSLRWVVNSSPCPGKSGG
jgi:peptidoglycan/LPS O-acetylase OafA/YrhL